MPNRDYFRLRCDLRMSAENSETAEILIYGQITSFKWRKEDPEVTAKEFDEMLKDAKAKGAKKLNLRINSPGGAVFQAVAMRTMLMNAGFDEINVSIDGLCASAATLMACIPGAHVTINEGAMYMIHNPASVAWGDARVMEHEAGMLRKIENDMHSIYAKRCGKDEKDVKTLMDEETWFTAKEAVDNGFADEFSDGAQVAACVGTSVMAAMLDMYKHVPSSISAVADNVFISNLISNAGSGVASATASENNPINKEDHSMEFSQITREQLMQERPDLFSEISNAGADAERTRMQEIDDLTPPGYETMAAEAKANGESAMDFHKRIIKAQRESGTAFLAGRRNETAPSAQVTGGSAGDSDDPDKVLDDSAKEVAAYAESYRDSGQGGMF